MSFAYAPGLSLPGVVEAGLGHAAGELAVLDGEVDHVEALVLGAVACLLPADAVARVSLANTCSFFFAFSGAHTRSKQE